MQNVIYGVSAKMRNGPVLQKYSAKILPHTHMVIFLCSYYSTYQYTICLIFYKSLTVVLFFIKLVKNSFLLFRTPGLQTSFLPSRRKF